MGGATSPDSFPLVLRWPMPFIVLWSFQRGHDTNSHLAAIATQVMAADRRCARHVELHWKKNASHRNRRARGPTPDSQSDLSERRLGMVEVDTYPHRIQTGSRWYSRWLVLNAFNKTTHLTSLPMQKWRMALSTGRSPKHQRVGSREAGCLQNKMRSVMNGPGTMVATWEKTLTLESILSSAAQSLELRCLQRGYHRRQTFPTKTRSRAPPWRVTSAKMLVTGESPCRPGY
jgi:hypothetical protein